MVVYKKTDEWYIEWHRMTTSGTTNGNEWQRVIQRVAQQVTINDKKWQRVIKNDNE